VGFEPTILVSERPKTHALDRTDTGIGSSSSWANYIKQHAIKWLGVEVQIHTFLNPKVDRGKGISSPFWPLYSSRWHSTPLRWDRRFVGPQSRSGHWQTRKAPATQTVMLWFTVYQHLPVTILTELVPNMEHNVKVTLTFNLPLRPEGIKFSLCARNTISRKNIAEGEKKHQAYSNSRLE
jgi:hypothetical protein